MIYARFGKRVLDIGLSTLGLVGCLPLFALLAMLVKVSGPGPVLFRQERMGKNGKVFRVMKFRTMRPTPGDPLKEFSPGDDSRVTPVGRLLRKAKLDELPQLLNVLLGDMSLVGPRPEVPEYRPFYRGDWERVLEVKPGITDFASLKYRQEDKLLRGTRDPEWSYRNEILPDKLRINLEYTRNIRVENDLKILWETFLGLVLPRKQMGNSR